MRGGRRNAARGWSVARRALAPRVLVPLLLVPLAGLALAGPAGAQARYIAFGDSITSGVGDDPDRVEPGYPPRLEDLLQDAGRDVVVENHGLGGERTPEGLTRLDSVLSRGGALLLLMEGSNDISRGISIETTLENLREMARKAANRGMPTIHATLIPRIPWAQVDAENELNRELAGLIRHMAWAQSRKLADHFEVFGSEPDVFVRLYQQVPTDYVGHPNAAGYDLMAQTWFDVLENIDSVPPVTGRVEPAPGSEGVRPDAEVFVELLDFGAGIDVFATELEIDGQPVTAAVTGDGRRLEVTWQPGAPLSGVVDVVLVSQDEATPPNELRREVTSFAISGTVFIPGDLDRDGRVDGGDLVAFALTFGSLRGEPNYNRQADFNRDDVIDGEDLAVVASNFGRTSP